MSCQPVLKNAMASCYGNIKEIDMFFLDVNLSMKINEDWKNLYIVRKIVFSAVIWLHGN